MMKLIADHNIPFVSNYFAHCDITLCPGETITRDMLLNAQMLIVRTVTPINAQLLENTPIQFVGSATTGTDHIDITWLAAQRNITLATAAGANAPAVAEYVLCCIAALRTQGYLTQKRPIAGIVGCGRIGRLVATQLQLLGFQVLCYDPLLTDPPNFTFTTLNHLLEAADFITLHTPLTYTGEYPTHHLLDTNTLSRIRPGAVVLNTARGAVIDQQAALQSEHITFCLDVWENEPYIDQALLRKALIATPHIAGYSLDAKRRATEMIYTQAADFFDWQKKITTSRNDQRMLNLTKHWEKQVLSIYNPLTQSKQFLQKLQVSQNAEEIANNFILERQTYPLRRAL